MAGESAGRIVAGEKCRRGAGRIVAGESAGRIVAGESAGRIVAGERQWVGGTRLLHSRRHLWRGVTRVNEGAAKVCKWQVWATKKTGLGLGFDFVLVLTSHC